MGKRAKAESAGSITTNFRTVGVEPHNSKPSPRDVEGLYLRGCVDEFCIFNRVLPQPEIAELAGRKQ